MKKLFIAAPGLLLAMGLFAQTDSSKIEQYCQVVATPKLLSNKVTIDIDFGEEKRFWADERLRTEQGKLKKFNTIIDALNYMGRNGWVFINAYPVHLASTEIFHFAFKKTFNREELR